MVPFWSLLLSGQQGVCLVFFCLERRRALSLPPASITSYLTRAAEVLSPATAAWPRMKSGFCEGRQSPQRDASQPGVRTCDGGGHGSKRALDAEKGGRWGAGLGEKGVALGKEVVCTEVGVRPKTTETPSCSRFPQISVMSHATRHAGRGVRCGQKEGCGTLL